jgi:hypothetical protein
MHRLGKLVEIARQARLAEQGQHPRQRRIVLERG